MAEGVGPIYAAGFQQVVRDSYALLYLPDLHNDELQREGKPPIYYWLPNGVRLAQKPNNDYKFHFTSFAGILDDATNVGVNEDTEVAGGLLSLSTTSAPPADVLREAEQELLDRFRGDGDRYWGWRTPAAPMFRPAMIVSNTTSITNLSPNGGGSEPVVPVPADGTRAAGALRSFRPGVLQPRSSAQYPRTYRVGDAMRGSGLDLFYANLQGTGSGSVNPFAENAYSGLVGSIPAALIWTSFHGGTGGLSVWQHLKLRVWSPVVRILIEGEWSRIQAHFSAAAKLGGVFWSHDIQAEFNYMRTDGLIKVTVEVDTTLPNAERIQQEIQERSNLVYQTFMDQAKAAIFEPAPLSEQAAQASSGGLLAFGGSTAWKLRTDVTQLNLRYDEKREMAYLQDYPISGALEGMSEVIQNDPSAERKYFTRVDLGEWNRKVHRVIKPVINWPDPARNWVGDPVAFMSAQVGYPTEQGAVMWAEPFIFQTGDGASNYRTAEFLMKREQDVTNPPAGWKPDKVFVKRKIHFSEPPSEFANPRVRMSVEKNEVDLDPGDYGRLTSELTLEARVDSAGVLRVGPIMLGKRLSGDNQMVEVTFKAFGTTDEGHERPPVKFVWRSADQDEPRYWMIFTGQTNFIPRFQYQVRVIVSGDLFTDGMEWRGSWVESSGNGELIVSIPKPNDQGVRTREYLPDGTMRDMVLGTVSSTNGSGNGNGSGSAGRPPTPETTSEAGGTGSSGPGRPPRAGVPASQGDARDFYRADDIPYDFDASMNS